MAEHREWVQVGSMGVSVPEGKGLEVACEMMVDQGKEIGSVHEEECGMARSLMEPGGGVCSCTPFIVKGTVGGPDG
jgi:hypothetical protein